MAQVASGNTEAPRRGLRLSPAVHRLCGVWRDFASLSRGFLIWGMGITIVAALFYGLNEVMHLKCFVQRLAHRKCPIRSGH